MKNITFSAILMAIFIIGGASSSYAQINKKTCACSTGETTLTTEEAQILRDNYSPTTHRSNLIQPENWGIKNNPKYLSGGKEQVFDSKGTEFWLTMMRNYDTSNPYLYLDITSSENASGSVEIAGIGFLETFTVAANTITRVNLPAAAMVGNDEIVNKGIHVLADNEVTVYGMNRIEFTTDAFLGLPVDILSTQYLAMTYSGYSTASFAPEFAIVSPYDNNAIQITPTSNTIGGFLSGNTYNVVLNAGQVYQVIGYGDLTGSIVQSSLPIAFFSGNSCTNIPAGVSYCDHIAEQILPNTTWGSTFVTYPLAGRLHGDTWRFLSAQDNTELYINSVYVTTLNFGDFYETILETSAYVTATNPILAAQFSNGNDWDPELANNGDPFMTIIPPYQQFMSNYSFATPSTGFTLNYANLTVESVGVPYQYLDNTLVDPSTLNSISTSGFSGGALPLTVGTHAANNTNSNQFGIYIYGFDADDSYGYPGGLSLEFITQASGPVIALTPATILINSTSQSAGSDIEITASITDNQEPFVQGATLYYRKIGDVSYLTVPMVKGTGDIWSGTIPAGVVIFPGVQYYIFATDGQVSATSPGVDPVNNPYSVAVDNQPPQIIHTPVTFAGIGIDIPIAAQVTDVTEFLQSVQLFYRVAGGNPVYTMLMMNITAGSNYEAVIPGAEMTALGIEYYIRATDNYGVISTSGTADNPYFIAAGTSECINPTGGGEIGNAQTNCSGFNPDAITSVTLPTGYLGLLEYKWQYSTDMTSFFDIGNSNSETYDPELILQTTWYKRLARVACIPDWMGAAESNVISMTIEDNENPVFTCPGDITICYADSAFQVNTLPYTPPTDNCGIASLTNDQPEIFPLGETIVTWIATDLSGNTTSCTMIVTRSLPVAVSISQGNLPEFCQGEAIVLTANITGTPAESYLWSTGEDSETIQVGASGNYGVTVTNEFGCESSASIDVTLNITNLLSSYVILTNNYIKLDGTTVYDGGLGVKNPWFGMVEARNHSTVSDAGTFAKARIIWNDCNSVISNKFYSPATPEWPAFESMLCNGIVTFNVPANTTMTIDGAFYREVKLGKNATAIFTQPVLNIGKICMEDGATLKFMQCTKVHLKEGLFSKKNITINPDELSVVFYIDNDVLFKEGARVTGVLYLGNSMPHAWWKHSLWVSASKTSRPAVFKGMFLAESVFSGKNTSWYMAPACNNCAPVVMKELAFKASIPVSGNGILLKNYPNPFSGKTRLVFMLPEANRVKLDVFDLSGKLIKTLYNGDVVGDQKYTAEFDGSALPVGLYIYKMTTNGDVITGKMILNK